MPVAQKRRRRPLRWLVVAVLVVLGALAAVRAVAPARPPLPVIGSMNGVKLSIPRAYLFFPVEYLGETVWAPRKDKPVRTYESRISNFSVYVQYQRESGTFQPRMHAINQNSYVKSLKTSGPHDWFMVTPQTYELSDDMKRQLKGKRRGDRTKSLNGILEARLSGQYFDKGPEGKVEVHYELLGFNETLKLNRALPVGPGVERFNSWNMALYWSGERDSIVTTYISCWNGALISGGIGKCEQEYYIPELDASVTVDYRSNWLPSWKLIQEHTKSLLLSFAVAGSNSGLPQSVLIEE